MSSNFCFSCRKKTEYIEKVIEETHVIKDKEYVFKVTRPICKECGCDMGLPEYIDKNQEEIRKQYREREGLVQISEIEDLMDLYSLGKSTLPIVLGFGEITITRYLQGQIPSTAYSNVIKDALASPAKMQKAIEDKKDSLTNAAYTKAKEAADRLVSLFSMSSKITGAIGFLVEQLDEITPMALQKMLYYADGIYAAKYNKPMFIDECEAWTYGPVYHDVYTMVRCLSSNVKDDKRFAIIKENIKELDDTEKEVIKLVANTFGNYSAIYLSNITHKEDPWKNARRGYADADPCNECITKESMGKYFSKVDKKFGLSTDEQINEYLKSMQG